MSELNKEIDLIELYQKTLVFLVKNIFTFILFMTLGIALGMSYYYYTSNIIKTRYVAEMKDTPKVLILDLTEKVAFEINRGAFDTISKEMNTSIDVISKIKSLSVDTTGNYLNISIVSKDKKSLAAFAKGLVYYYNNQPYIKKTFLAQKEAIREINEITKTQIIKLEQIQNKFLSDTISDKVTINQMGNRQGEIISLYKKKQEYKAVLKKTKAITLINLTDNLVKAQNNLIKILVTSIFISLFFSLVFFFIRYSYRLVKLAKK